MTNIQENEVIKEVKIKRVFPDDLQSHFVPQFVIQHRGDHFILSFFELWPPPLLAKNEEELMQMVESLGEIESKCVARLVLTNESMREFYKVLTENLEKNLL